MGSEFDKYLKYHQAEIFLSDEFYSDYFVLRDNV